VAKDVATELADKLKLRCSENNREYIDPILWLYDFATGVIGEEIEMTPGKTKIFPAKSGERLKAMVAITEYLYPKQKSVEVTADQLIKSIITIAREDADI
jgi:hypothetical protein